MASLCFDHALGCDANTGEISNEGLYVLCSPAVACLQCFPNTKCTKVKSAEPTTTTETPAPTNPSAGAADTRTVVGNTLILLAAALSAVVV